MQIKSSHMQGMGLILITIAMIETSCVHKGSVQEPLKIASIEWSVPVELPPSSGSETQPGLAGPVVGVIGNCVLVAGGANFPGGMPWLGAKKVYHDDIYIVEKKKNGGMQARQINQKLPQPVAYCSSVSLPAGILYVGGEDGQGISKDVFLIKEVDIVNDLIVVAMPPLPVALTNLSAAHVGNMVYVAGGNSIDGNSSHFFSLDMGKLAAGWQSLPDIPVKIAFAAMAVQSKGDHDYIYLMGGRRKSENGMSDIFNTLYLFDIKNKQWHQKQSLPYPVSAGTAVAVDNDYILLISGDKGETFRKEEKLNVAINLEKNEEKRKALLKEKIDLLQSHPGFTNEVWLYHSATDTWKRTSGLPSDRPVTTTAIIWDNDILVPSGEIKAGVRTPGILRGKIKR